MHLLFEHAFSRCLSLHNTSAICQVMQNYCLNCIYCSAVHMGHNNSTGCVSMCTSFVCTCVFQHYVQQWAPVMTSFRNFWDAPKTIIWQFFLILSFNTVTSRERLNKVALWLLTMFKEKGNDWNRKKICPDDIKRKPLRSSFHLFVILLLPSSVSPRAEMMIKTSLWATWTLVVSVRIRAMVKSWWLNSWTLALLFFALRFLSLAQRCSECHTTEKRIRMLV